MLTIPKDRVHFSFDAEALAAAGPAGQVKSGERVRFECQDCYSEQIVHDGFDFSRIDMERNNPATGPLFIEGAMPGDILRVRILSIELGPSGCMTARRGTGTYEIEGFSCRRFPIEGDVALFDEGIRIPLRPMVGVLGTAAAAADGRLAAVSADAGLPFASTQIPGEHGGNLDIRDLGAGATIYLPVNVEGALLSMGDIHAVQGDGETVICALEASGAVTVEVEVLKGRKDIPVPFILTERHYLTTAACPSLDDASVEAARRMHRFLVGHTDLGDARCGMLLSLAGNLRISQIVNPAKGCIMEFPRGLAGEHFEP